eukprot:366546-Chlamydomonas_euryale.AAC.31
MLGECAATPASPSAACRSAIGVTATAAVAAAAAAAVDAGAGDAAGEATTGKKSAASGLACVEPLQLEKPAGTRSPAPPDPLPGSVFCHGSRHNSATAPTDAICACAPAAKTGSTTAAIRPSSSLCTRACRRMLRSCCCRLTACPVVAFAPCHAAPPETLRLPLLARAVHRVHALHPEW